MAIFETFSKRQKKRDRQGQADVYQYTSLPKEFRAQVIHIWEDTLGRYYDSKGNYAKHYPRWVELHDILAKELGIFELSSDGSNKQEKCRLFFMSADTDGALDIIELAFIIITDLYPGAYYRRDISDDPVVELNTRFQEHGIGYQFTGSELIRVDSQFMHAEVVRPAISLLADEGFDGASDEFLRAHKHYRHERHKEAIVEALKAFESTMKTICDLRTWPYDTKATAKPLIDLLVSKGLIPSDLLAHFGAVRSTLESGLPTLRNRRGGHGQGKEPVTVPGHVAAYALHLAASNILFLVEAHKAMK